MMTQVIQGSPLPEKLLAEAPGAERFWFWRGASGRKYIHTIYGWGECPPVPGAVFIAVKRVGRLRQAVAVERFPAIWDHAFSAFNRIQADEVHVHLLARDHAHAEDILADLRQAFEASPKLQLVRAA